MSQGLDVEGVSKSFGAEKVLDDITFTLERRKIGALVGPSGAGKSTLLNIMSGLIRADAGKISIDGDVVESNGTGRANIHAKPTERNIGYVFQDYVLFPHMSVFENVAYGLRAHRISEMTVKEKVLDVLSTMGLQDLRERKPAQISGGQMQRVALARAMILEPRLLLLDEPLGALDRHTRETLRVELRRIFDNLGTTVIYVTHDLDEAFFFGQNIGIIRSGSLPFFGRKTELLSQMSRSTADFLGFNLLKVRYLRPEGSGYLFLVPGWGDSQVKIPLVDGSNLNAGQDALIAIPPGSLKVVVDSKGSPQLGIHARIKEVWEFKDRVQLVVGEDSPAENRLVGEISTQEFHSCSFNQGDSIRIIIDGASLISDKT